MSVESPVNPVNLVWAEPGIGYLHLGGHNKALLPLTNVHNCLESLKSVKIDVHLCDLWMLGRHSTQSKHDIIGPLLNSPHFISITLCSSLKVKVIMSLHKKVVSRILKVKRSLTTYKLATFNGWTQSLLSFIAVMSN